MATATPNIVEKFEEEAKKKPGAIEMLSKAISSKANFMAFIFNPHHYIFLGLMVVACYGTFWCVLRLMQAETIGGVNLGQATALACLEVAALWVAAVASLVQTTIQDQVDYFRGLNTKLEKTIKELNGDISTMTEQCDKLGDNLRKFDSLRKEMEAEADRQGIQLSDFKDACSGVFDRMGQLQADQEITLLERIAADVEFRDDTAGLNLAEFKRFCSRVPKKYRSEFENEEARFKEIAGSDEIIDGPELEAFIKQIVDRHKGEKDN